MTARPKRSITCHDRRRGGGTSGDGTEHKARAAVACHGDRCTTGLADAVGGRAGGGEGDEGQEGEGFEKVHGALCAVCMCVCVER